MDKKLSKNILYGAGAGILIVLIAIAIVVKMNADQKVEDRKQARAERLHKALIRRAKEVKREERKRWNLLVRGVAESRRNRRYDEALAKLNAFAGSHQEKEYLELIDEEKSKINSAIYRDKKAAEKALETLKAKAAALIDKKEFARAADVYKNYSGEYAVATGEERARLAEECLSQAKQLRENVETKAEEAKKAMVEKIASLLLVGKFKTALEEFNASKASSGVEDEEFLASMEKTLIGTANAHKACVGSFLKEINKKISVPLKNGKSVSGTLKRVSSAAVYIQVPKTRTIAVVKPVRFRDMALDERFNRVSDKVGAEAAALYCVAIAVVCKDYSAALDKANSTGPFAERFASSIADLESVAQQNVSASAAQKTATPAVARPKALKEQEQALIPPVMAAHRLCYYNVAGNRKQLIGKTVTVTGMVCQIATSGSKGTRLDLFDGKVVCFVKPMSLLPVQRFYKVERRKRVNKRYEYKDFLIKVTVKGVVRPTSKANAVELGDAEIVNWYGVTISGDGNSLRFSIAEKPTNTKIASYLSPHSGEGVDLEGFATKDAMKGGRLALVLNKKLKTYMGNDSLSLATEIRAINRIMIRKGFKGELILQLNAEVENREMELYQNARILEWKVVTDRVTLYPIQSYIDDPVPLTKDNSL